MDVNADLRDLVRAAERVAADAGLDDIVQALRQDRAERDRPGVRVAVVGDFSRGKSTLLNRLVGAEVLPTGSPPIKRPVVVRPLPDGQAFLDVRWPSGPTERRWLSADAPWRGLARDQDLFALPVDEGQADADEPHVVLYTPSQWLTQIDVALIDTPGWSEDRTDRLPQTVRAIAMSDVVVLAIAASSPLSIVERRFLHEELVNKRVPYLIVVLTKVDQLPGNEVVDFAAWFSAQIADMSPEIAVLLGPGLSPEGGERLAELRDRIGELAQSSDIIRRRDRRLAGHLAEGCAAIKSAAAQAISQLENDEAARRAAVAAVKDQLAEDGLRWDNLRLGLTERRSRFVEAIQDTVKSATHELFEVLDLELSRVDDIKAWWEQELPVRLRRELKYLTSTLESQISSTISQDLSWLDGEVTRAFAVSNAHANAHVASAATTSTLPHLELEDVRRRRTVTRVISAAGGIAGAAIAFASGIGVPAAFTIGGGAIAAIIAERDADSRLADQRALVRKQLRLLLDDLVAQFREKLAAEVDRSYRVAFEELQAAQTAWQTSRLEALTQLPGSGFDVTMWIDAQRQADEILARIPGDLGIDRAADSASRPSTQDPDPNDHEGDQP